MTKTMRKTIGAAGHVIYEYVDHPDRVLLGDTIIQIFRKQDALPAVLTLDEALHPNPRSR